VSPGGSTERWRRAGEPVAAHDLAHALLGPRRYAHTRGVAQQAARLARLTRLDRAGRARLLAAAWLHDVGYGLGGGFHPLLGARALRRAGHEDLARIVAHHSGAAVRAALLGMPPLAAEFPTPQGPDRRLLGLLDVADLTTGPEGDRMTPAARLRDLASRRGAGDPRVRVLVAAVAALAEDPPTRELVERISPGVAV
jgi:hypothetical protein